MVATLRLEFENDSQKGLDDLKDGLQVALEGSEEFKTTLEKLNQTMQNVAESEGVAKEKSEELARALATSTMEARKQADVQAELVKVNRELSDVAVNTVQGQKTINVEMGGVASAAADVAKLYLILKFRQEALNKVINVGSSAWKNHSGSIKAGGLALGATGVAVGSVAVGIIAVNKAAALGVGAIRKMAQQGNADFKMMQDRIDNVSRAWEFTKKSFIESEAVKSQLESITTVFDQLSGAIASGKDIQSEQFLAIANAVKEMAQNAPIAFKFMNPLVGLLDQLGDAADMTGVTDSLREFINLGKEANEQGNMRLRQSEQEILVTKSLGEIRKLEEEIRRQAAIDQIEDLKTVQREIQKTEMALALAADGSQDAFKKIEKLRIDELALIRKKRQLEVQAAAEAKKVQIKAAREAINFRMTQEQQFANFRIRLTADTNTERLKSARAAFEGEIELIRLQEEFERTQGTLTEADRRKNIDAIRKKQAAAHEASKRELKVQTDAEIKEIERASRARIDAIEKAISKESESKERAKLRRQIEEETADASLRVNEKAFQFVLKIRAQEADFRRQQKQQEVLLAQQAAEREVAVEREKIDKIKKLAAGDAGKPGMLDSLKDKFSQKALLDEIAKQRAREQGVDDKEGLRKIRRQVFRQSRGDTRTGQIDQGEVLRAQTELQAGVVKTAHAQGKLGKQTVKALVEYLQTQKKQAEAMHEQAQMMENLQEEQKALRNLITTSGARQRAQRGPR